MKIESLSKFGQHTAEIAQWYYDEWVDASSPRTLDDLENEIRERVSLGAEIPHYYVALDNDRLCGVFELKYRENISYPDYVHWLGSVYVNPVTRGKGVAANMVRHAKMRASELDIKEFYLQCDEKLVSMYEKHDFRKLHAAKHHDWDTIIMSCQL